MARPLGVYAGILCGVFRVSPAGLVSNLSVDAKFMGILLLAHRSRRQPPHQTTPHFRKAAGAASSPVRRSGRPGNLEVIAADCRKCWARFRCCLSFIAAEGAVFFARQIPYLGRTLPWSGGAGNADAAGKANEDLNWAWCKTVIQQTVGARWNLSGALPVCIFCSGRWPGLLQPLFSGGYYMEEKHRELTRSRDG